MVGIRLADKPHRNPQKSDTKFLEQLTKGYYAFQPHESWKPNVNLYETEAGYLVCVDLAGIDKTKIEVEAADGWLTIRGARAIPVLHNAADAQGSRVRLHLMEIDHGPFARDVELPSDVSHEHISAGYTDGLLWIELPRKS